MTAAQGASGTGAPTDAQPGAPATPQANGATPPEPGASETPISNPEAKRYADEAAVERKARRAAEAELKKFQDAQLSDLEKAQKQATAAEQAIAAMRARIGATELKVASQAAGIIDPDVAAALLGARVEYDAAGEPQNVAELVTELKKTKPHLFGTGSQQSPQRQAPQPSAGATNPGRQAGNAGLTLEIIQQLSPRDLRARASEIAAWYKQQQQLPT